MEGVRDLKHGRVHLLQSIDTLLKLNVVWGQLSLSWAVSASLAMGSAGMGDGVEVASLGGLSHLVLNLANLLLDILLRPGGPWRKGGAIGAWSAYLDVGNATGEEGGGNERTKCSFRKPRSCRGSPLLSVCATCPTSVCLV